MELMGNKYQILFTRSVGEILLVTLRCWWGDNTKKEYMGIIIIIS
jgi:hypothetical protein